MADTVSKKNNDHFTNQALLHRNFADHTRQMVSQYQALHDNMLSEVQPSSLGDSLGTYRDWWESFSTHLLKKAALHEQMADHLERAVNGFDEVDGTIQQVFSTSDAGFSS